MQKTLIATRLDEETVNTLKGIAARKDRTVAYLMRKAIEEYVKVEQRKGRQAA